MAKRVVWSSIAKQQRKEILEYWKDRNQSMVYPKKLNKIFNDTIQVLAKYPNPRQLTNFGSTYVKIVLDYKIFFKEDSQSIFIITIWDTRRNPNDLDDILQ